MRTLYGRVLRAARRKSGLTQEKLADLLCMGQPNVSDIEHGKHVGPEPTQGLALALNVERNYLLAAWKLSQPMQLELDKEQRATRRYWFHLMCRQFGLDMSIDEFDQMMTEHVDPNHMKGSRK